MWQGITYPSRLIDQPLYPGRINVKSQNNIVMLGPNVHSTYSGPQLNSRRFGCSPFGPAVLNEKHHARFVKVFCCNVTASLHAHGHGAALFLVDMRRVNATPRIKRSHSSSYITNTRPGSQHAFKQVNILEPCAASPNTSSDI